MLSRFLGGAAACLGAAGMLPAQQPQLPPAFQTTTPPQPTPPQAGPGPAAPYGQPQYAPEATPSRPGALARLLGRGTSAPTQGTLVVQQAPPAPKPAAPIPTTPAPSGVKPAAPVPTTPAPVVTPAKPADPTAKPATDKPADPAAKPTDAPKASSGQLLIDGGKGTIVYPTAAACDACPAPCLDACCTPCGPPGRLWIDAGYILWTARGQNLPPLVTTAPAGTPRADAAGTPIAGALGQPGTGILFPTGRTNTNWRSGFYLNAGYWFDKCQTCGIEGNFFFLGNSTDRFSAASPGETIIARPFFNTQTGLPDTQLVSFPNVLNGSIDVRATNKVIGGGPNFVKNLCCGPCGRFDLLLGYTYLNVTDEVVIRENLTSLPGQTNVTPGTNFLVEDRFRTSNNFHGGNIGFAAERRWSHWYVGVRAGVGIGVNHQVIDISGSTTITPPGGPSQTFPGGLLTQPSNIGHYTRDRFAVLPWIGGRIGCQLTDRTRVYVGYDFLALSNAVRAGEQIDLRVNPTQIPPRTAGTTGTAFPQFDPRESTFWVQGIRFGAEFRF
jgi:hypothetical protein